MGGEGVLETEVEHRADAVEIELRTIDLVDLHAAKRQPHHLGVAEVLGAVRRERHARGEARDETDVDKPALAAGDEHVLRLDVLVPEARAVVAIERGGQSRGPFEHAAKAVRVEPLLRTEPMQRTHRLVEVRSGEVGHRVPEASRLEAMLDDESQSRRRFHRTRLADDLRKRRALREREGLDDDAVEPVGQATSDLRGGLRDEQPSAGSACRKRADDLVAREGVSRGGDGDRHWRRDGRCAWHRGGARRSAVRRRADEPQAERIAPRFAGVRLDRRDDREHDPSEQDDRKDGEPDEDRREQHADAGQDRDRDVEVDALAALLVEVGHSVLLGEPQHQRAHDVAKGECEADEGEPMGEHRHRPLVLRDALGAERRRHRRRAHERGWRRRRG